MFQPGKSPLRLRPTLFGLTLLALMFGLIGLIGARTSPLADRSLPKDCKPAMLKAIVDADTIDVFYSTGEPMSWVRSAIHVRGIAAPRSGTMAGCTAERELGHRAVGFLRSHLPGAHLTTLLLRVCKPESAENAKGRVADVFLKRKGQWRSAAELMVDAGYAFPTHGNRKASWCDCLDHGDCPAGLRWRFKVDGWWFE